MWVYVYVMLIYIVNCIYIVNFVCCVCCRTSSATFAFVNRRAARMIFCDVVLFDL